MRLYLLFILFSLIIYVKSLGCAETLANSYTEECKTYENEHDLGDSHCCYSEWYSEDFDGLQKFCIQLSKDEYENIENFVSDMKNGVIEDYIQADIIKIDCGTKSYESSKSSYLVLNLLSFLIGILLLI